MDKTTPNQSKLATGQAKIIIGIIIAVVIITIGYLVYRKSSEPTLTEPIVTTPISEEVIKIGAILPLTGKAANYGEEAKAGLEIALEEINKGGKKVEIIYEDSKCDAKEAVSIFHSLFNIRKTKYIIGPCCSPATLAVAPLAEQNQVILITPMSSAETISEAGDFIFRNHTHDKTEVEKITPYVAKKYKKVAFIYDKTNDAMVQQHEWFLKAFTDLSGGEVIDAPLFGDSGDYRTELLKLKPKLDEIDAIFLYLLTKDSIIVIKQLDELKIKKPIIANKAAITSGDFVNNVGKDLAEGIIYAEAAYNKDTNPEFWDKYHNKTGKISSIWSAQSYDTLKILSLIFEKCGADDTICVKDELYTIEYYGAAGKVSFDEKGDAIKEIAIKVIKSGEFVPYEE